MDYKSTTRTTAFLVVVLLMGSTLVTGAVDSPGPELRSMNTAPDSTPTVTVENASVDPGETTTVDIVLSNVSNGVAGYNITLSVGNASAARISGATVSNAFSYNQTDLNSQHSAISIQAADVNDTLGTQTTTVTLASVTVEGVADARTELAVDVTQIDDDQGVAMQPQTTNGRLIVGSPPALPSVRLRNLSVDPDATATADIVLTNASTRPAGYNLTLTLEKSGIATIQQVNYPSHMDDFTRTKIGSAKESARLKVVEVSPTSETIDGEFKLATVTFAGASPGRTGIDLRVTQLDDVNGDRIGATGRHHSLTVTGPIFETSGLAVEPTTGMSPLTVTATARVTNTGTESGVATIPLSVNGEIVETTDVAVSKGTSTNISFTYTFETVGDHTVAIGDLPAETVSVEESPTVTAETADIHNRSTVSIQWEALLTDNASAVAYRLDDGARAELNISSNEFVSDELTLNVTDGDHTVEFILLDENGERLPYNSSHTTVSFHVDTVDPTITLDSHSESATLGPDDTIQIGVADATLDNGTVTVSGSSGIETVTRTPNAQEISIGNLSFESEGPVSVTVVAVDGAENVANETFTFHLMELPTISSLTPENGSVVNANTTITARYSDELSGIDADSVTVRVDERVVAAETTTTEATVDISTLALVDGEHVVSVSVTDHAGFTTTRTANIILDTTKPIVTLTNLESPTDESTLETPVYTNGTLNLSATADGTPDTPQQVTFHLNATSLPFETTFDGHTTDGAMWSATSDLSSLPDDGRYLVTADATDAAGNTNTTTRTGVVILDRVRPTLRTTITRMNETHGQITVIADEQLVSHPNVTLTFSNGTTKSLDVRYDGERTWRSAFAFGGTGTYRITASGLDAAGNRGTSTASTTLQSVDTMNRTAIVETTDSGLFIRFNTTRDVSETRVMMTGSQTELAPLPRDLVGVSFLEAHLGNELAANLETATIGIPVETTELPANVTPEDVELRYYNASDGKWEPRETTLQTISGTDGTTTQYWTTEVTHFSTYGAVVTDTEPPVVTEKTPDGETFPFGTHQATVRFDYTDALSDVNASAVELRFGDVSVTDSPRTTITSEYTTYTAVGLSPGTYESDLILTDSAGNTEQYTTSFTIEADTTSPSITSKEPKNGTTLTAGTKSIPLTISFADSQSGVNPETLTASFDGTDVTDETTVTTDSASYTATGLKNGTTHTFTIRFADNSGNRKQATLRFNVANATRDQSTAPAAGGGGGGGGGGNVPPPSVRVELTELAPNHIAAAISNARADAPGAISLPQSVGANDVRFTSIEVVPHSRNPEAKFTLDVQSSASIPAMAQPATFPSDAVSSLQITKKHISNSEIATATIRFRVATSVLENQAVSPASVSLYRYHDGTWQALETDFITKRPGGYVFEARSPGFSVFTVGMQKPSFSVTEPILSRSTVGPGEEVTASVLVENTGKGEGTFSADLIVDGTVIDTKTVTIPSEERKRVSFTRTFDTGGERSVAIGDTVLGTVSVVNGGESADPDAPQHDAGQSTADDSASVDIGAGVFILFALVVGGLLYIRRQ